MDAEGAGLSRVTAVVVNWNSGELCVKQLVSLAPAFEAGLRMVLVDNGSVDDSYEQLQAFVRQWPEGGQVDVVRSEENLGFCGGVNLGVDRALDAAPAPEFIWMLNPDAEVTVETVRELVAVARESGAAIVGVGGTWPFRSEGSWSRYFWTTPRWFLTPAPAGKRWWRAGWYGGACAVFTTAMVRDLVARDGHFLDPDLFMDADEWDISLRAKDEGALIVLARDAVAVHQDEGRIFGKSPLAAARQYYQSRNTVRLARTHLPWWQFVWMLPVHTLRDLSWFARLRLNHIQPNERAYVLGLIDGLRGKGGKWKHHPPSPAAKR